MLIKPLPGVIVDFLHPLSHGGVCHLLFNEGAGNFAYDVSGHGNHGVLKNMVPNSHGTKWQASKFGGGLAFDGGNDYLTFPKTISIADEATFTLWINTTEATNGAGIIANFDHLGGDKMGFGIGINDDASNGLVFFRTYLNNSRNCDIASTSRIDDGIWHFVAVTFSGGIGRIYIDGELETTSTSGKVLVKTSATMTIGGDDGVTWASCNATLDEVFISLQEFNAQEIKQLYHNPFCNLLKTPIWKRYVLVTVRERSHGYIF